MTILESSPSSNIQHNNVFDDRYPTFGDGQIYTVELWQNILLMFHMLTMYTTAILWCC